MAKVGRLVKELMIQELTAALRERPSFFVASIGPLHAVEADTLRKRLRTVNARLFRVRRKLGLQGFKALDINGGTTAMMDGSVGLVLPGEDIVPAAKLLVDFAKENHEKLAVRGGLVEGQVLDKKGLEFLASLPSKPQLIAELIGVLESPITDVILTLEGALGELAWILEEAAKAKPVAPAAQPEAGPADRARGEGDSAPAGEPMAQPPQDAASQGAPSATA